MTFQFKDSKEEEEERKKQGDKNNNMDPTGAAC